MQLLGTLGLTCIGVWAGYTIASPTTQSTPQARADTEHSIEYWRAIVKDSFRVPNEANPLELLIELGDAFGSPDPELRDRLAYEISARWIVHTDALPSDQLSRLVDAWSSQLRDGIGESNTPSVLKRSFSALGLSLLAARDNRDPFLDSDRFANLLAAALDYLRNEQDVRGWAPGVGWYHSVAHTADLLKFLVRNAQLTQDDQHTVLACIADKLAQTAVFLNWGEDERLARAILSIIAREDFRLDAFEPFLEQLQLSTAPQPGDLDPAQFAARQNAKQLLRALHTFLVAAGALTEDQALARDATLNCLMRM